MSESIDATSPYYITLDDGYLAVMQCRDMRHAKRRAADLCLDRDDRVSSIEKAQKT